MLIDIGYSKATRQRSSKVQVSYSYEKGIVLLLYEPKLLCTILKSKQQQFSNHRVVQ
jgi:hypothetical protein